MYLSVWFVLTTIVHQNCPYKSRQVIFCIFWQWISFIYCKEEWNIKEPPQWAVRWRVTFELQVTDCTPPTPQQGNEHGWKTPRAAWSMKSVLLAWWKMAGYWPAFMKTIWVCWAVNKVAAQEALAIVLNCTCGYHGNHGTVSKSTCIKICTKKLKTKKQ